MSNHVHLIISAKENNVSYVHRDFKKFTSKQIIKAITEHPGESRRKWMLKIFKEAGENNSRNASYQFGNKIINQNNLYARICRTEIRTS
jgi:REP element-mobilizing transposase RayT